MSMPTATELLSAPLPREMVLASAGTGKTHHISSRIIGLLAVGTLPEAIFAATFTRKAAGEILDRVLARIARAALDDTAAQNLDRDCALVPGTAVASTCEEWLLLLRQVSRELHRLNIGTLDSFFVRAAAGFAADAGLAAGWSIADQVTAERVYADALHEVLARGNDREIVEMVRGLDSKDAARSVHDALLSRIGELLGLHYALDPRAADAWKGFGGITALPTDELHARCHRLADAFDLVERPLTKAGAPHKTWGTALSMAAESVRSGSWDSIISSTLYNNALQGDGRFSGIEVPEKVRDLLDEMQLLAGAVIGARLATRCDAMGRLVEHLASAVERKQRELGAYGFGDVTRLIGGADPLCRRADFHYRLDSRTHHILLDEFQDTSLAQWEALEPLLDELLLADAQASAVVVVADPKQSIYGWRGGEPLLVSHVGERYNLATDELSLSYRSSDEVLDAVNKIFHEIEGNAALAEDEVARGAAVGWVRAFKRHTAAKPLPGYVELQVGPHDEGRGEDRPHLCRRAAELVADLQTRAPGSSIGVLTRKNKTVARIMLELRDLGVAASEEGGNPLTDSAAVSAVLSLLRLADHPGDRIARYHVAKTPLGEVVGCLGGTAFTDYDDGRAARELSHRVRQRLLEDGYGHTLGTLAAALEDACAPRDARRLAQLVERAFRYDAAATLRTGDFIRIVEADRVEDPTTAAVRVMTVHQAKGLEFDIVVLPELDVPLVRGGAGALLYRPNPAGRATRVFPYISEKHRMLFPDLTELHAAAEQASGARWRDAFSGLYVALTRARRATYLLVKPDTTSAKGTITLGKTAAGLIRAALAPDAAAVEGEVLFQQGDADWYAGFASEANDVRPAKVSTGGAPARKLQLRAATVTKARAGLKPSDFAGGPHIELRSLLQLDRSAADRGTLAHAWFEQIGWLEDGVPTDAELLAIAARVAPVLGSEQVTALAHRFRGWLGAPEIRYLLSRAAYPAGATARCEAAFLHRHDGHLIEGIIDRLVLLHEGGRVCGAEILDYKTDALGSADPALLLAKAEHYRPQLNAYRAAVAHAYRLPLSAVAARLVVLEAAAVVAV